MYKFIFTYKHVNNNIYNIIKLYIVCSYILLHTVDPRTTQILTVLIHLYAVFSINTIDLFSFPYNYLNIFFSLAYFIVII